MLAAQGSGLVAASELPGSEAETAAAAAAAGVSGRRPQVLVGSHEGSLYALPADDMLVDAAPAQQSPQRWQQLQQQQALPQETLALALPATAGGPPPGAQQLEGRGAGAQETSQLVAVSSSAAAMDGDELCARWACT
jgi:hypothetical protein